ncbi:delta(24(24(1)))-sterol reductase [Sporobolomyces salmoneus]|uniref:delta(24(24(1)))-sterol reductase n=1 Tax=Sporobolomyces salmoneus TaxID=183962 RepID=UPI003181660A
MAASEVRQRSSVSSKSTSSSINNKDNTSLSSSSSPSSVDDVTHELEFGGAPGTLAMMIGFPLLFYYLYVCLFFNNAQFTTPTNARTIFGPGGWWEFLKYISKLVIETASPTKRATTLYLSFLSLQLVLAFILPGVTQQGLPVSSLGGKTLTYHCNAYSCVYSTVFIVYLAHHFHFFHLSEIIDLYGPLLSVASISGFLLAGVVYLFGDNYRMSGNWIYDYFMGSTLNPRIGNVDIKMFAEIRISWTLLFAIAMGGVSKQYELYGRTSGNAWLFAYGTALYLNACAKGEQYIPQTWDMNYEKFGWLLSYWNLAGVPFSYAYPAIYISTRDPRDLEFPTWVLVSLFVVLTVAHCLFDIAMAQKSHFKAVETNTYIKRYTFPQLPYAELENPKYLKTHLGGKLLLGGLWGYLRKPNYTFDSIQAIIWGISSGAGTKSLIVYWYPVFHAIMLLHRNGRDDARCARKYKQDWKEYQRLVPYSFIPYIY